MYFLYSAALNPLAILDLLDIRDFVTSFGRLENIGSLSYANVHFIIHIKKSHLLISPLILSEKPLSIRKMSSSWCPIHKVSEILTFV